MSPSHLSRLFVALRGVAVASAFVLFWTWLAASVRQLDPRIPAGIPEWLRPVGLLLAGAGALLAASCVATFVTRGRGTPAPFDPPRELVVSGPCGFVRNPMYLGAAAVILGAGLAVRSRSIVLLAVAFLSIAHVFVVLHEEPALTSRFGESYVRYRASVSRWIVRRPRA